MRDGGNQSKQNNCLSGWLIQTNIKFCFDMNVNYGLQCSNKIFNSWSLKATYCVSLRTRLFEQFQQRVVQFLQAATNIPSHAECLFL